MHGRVTRWRERSCAGQYDVFRRRQQEEEATRVSSGETASEKQARGRVTGQVRVRE